MALFVLVVLLTCSRFLYCQAPITTAGSVVLFCLVSAFPKTFAHAHKVTRTPARLDGLHQEQKDGDQSLEWK